jgi:hypothetical protein
MVMHLEYLHRLCYKYIANSVPMVVQESSSIIYIIAPGFSIPRSKSRAGKCGMTKNNLNDLE